MQGQVHRTVGAGIGAILACAVVSLAFLTGCSQAPDPTEHVESFSAVTEAPVSEDLAEEYSAELHPEPLVEASECSDYLVITARGTAEPSKGQMLSPVARTISNARPGQVEVLDLDYPAGEDMNLGGTHGARVLVDTLNVQHESCPEQRFVLLGYSQGALVVGDALSAPESRLVGAHVGKVSDEAAAQILAIVFYGNPRFVGSEPYNSGSFNEYLDGLLPRPAGTLDRFSERIRDYCVYRDFICQRDTFDLDEKRHVEYYSNGMQQDGAAFVISLMPPLGQENATDPSELTFELPELEPDSVE